MTVTCDMNQSALKRGEPVARMANVAEWRFGGMRWVRRAAGAVGCQDTEAAAASASGPGTPKVSFTTPGRTTLRTFECLVFGCRATR